MRTSVPPRQRENRSEALHGQPVRDVVKLAAKVAQASAEPGESLVLSSRPRKTVVLMQGNHGLVVVDVAGSTVIFAPGAYAEQLQIKASCTIVRADLEGSASRSGAVVQVLDGDVMFDGIKVSSESGPCMSISASSKVSVCAGRLDQKGGTYMVQIASGGKAVFTGVILGPAGSTVTNAIYNAGGLANVDVTGVVKLVPAGHTAVTNVSEV